MGNVINMVGGGGSGIKLSSIAVTTQPAKTTYNALEVFSTAGMIVTATYSNGATAQATGYTYDTSPLQYGTSSVTLTYTEGGVTKTTSVSITVNKNVLTIPSQSGSLTYSGSPQTVTWSGYDSSKMSKSGAESATNAGSYSATFTLLDTTNYQWSDSTSSDKTVTWTIGKASSSITPTSASATLNSSTQSATISFSKVGDGAVTASTSASNIATASISGSSVIISSVNQTSGSATITLNQAEGTNYLGSSATISVTCSFLEIVSWASGTDAQITAMINADRAGSINLRDYWSVGDTRSVSLSAMSATGVGESHAAQTVQFVLMDNVCTGFTWASTPASGITVPRFIVGMKNSLNEKGYMNSSSTNTGGWSSCARRTWCNSVFKPSLPSTLVGIFKEFSWKQGEGGSSSSGLNTTTDYFALAPEKAIFGSRSYSYSDEVALYSQWVWYQTSSNRVKKVGSSAYYWWECSPRSGSSSSFCNVASDGSASDYYASYTFGLAVFGCI